MICVTFSQSTFNADLSLMTRFLCNFTFCPLLSGAPGACRANQPVSDRDFVSA